MLNIGGMEILVILVVALVVLGPDKLPGLMRTVGKATKELRKASTDFQRTINSEIADEETPKPATSQPEQPPAMARSEPAAVAVAETGAAEATGKSKIRRAVAVPQMGRAGTKPLLRKKTASRRSPDDTETGAS